MVRKISTSQLRSKINQANQKQRQAISKYNAAVRQANRAIGNYNQAAAEHNRRVRAHQRQLQSELRRLESQQSTTGRIAVRRSTVRLHTAFTAVESQAARGTWQHHGTDLIDLAEREAANSAQTANTLIANNAAIPLEERATTITDELSQLDPDLDQRWRGALFALDARNPDAARHFCTSAREVVTMMLDRSAPDDVVEHAIPDCPKTDRGHPTRRAKVDFLLKRAEVYHPSLAQFVEDDVDDLLTLFREFNGGTHGSAGRFTLEQLVALQQRTEGAIQFAARLIDYGSS